MKKHLFLFQWIILLFTMLFFCFCNQDRDIEINDDEGFEAFNITDMIGRELLIEKKINRIIASYRPALHYILALKVYDKLVTAIDITGRPAKNDILATKIYPDIEKLPKIQGGSKKLNIEEIVSNSPDLLILYPNNPNKIIEKLSEFDIKSIVIDPENGEKIRKTVLLIGKVLDAEAQAKLLIDYFDKVVNDISTKIEQFLEKDKIIKPKVYYIDTNLLSTISGDMYQSQMIKDAYGISVTSELKGWKQNISYEELIKWNPDIIILSSYTKLTINDILMKQQIKEISAIKNNKIYKMPSNLDPWDFPVPNSIAGTYWLAHKFYPNIINKNDMMEFVNKFYKDIYGKSYEELEGKF